jgi:hypothetical protein
LSRATRRLGFALALFLAALGTPAAADPAPGVLTLSLSPGLAVPLGPGADYFGLGGGARLLAEYPLPWMAGLAAQGGLSYGLATLPYDAGTTSEIAILAGASWQMPLFLGLSARAFADLGVSYGLVNGDSLSQGGASAVIEAGGGVGWALGPALAVRLDLSYTLYSGAYGAFGAALGAAYAVLPPAVKPAPGDARPRPLSSPSSAVSIREITLRPVFPALLAASGAQSLGSLRIRNDSAAAVTGLTVTFTAEHVLDAPAACRAPSTLAPGEEAVVPIDAVLPTALRAAQGPRDVTAALTVSFTADGAAGRSRAAATLRVKGAGELPGEDRGEAAVFVDPADRKVQGIARAAAEAVRAEATPNIDPALLSAAGCLAASWTAGVRPGTAAAAPGTRGAEGPGRHGAVAGARSAPAGIKLPGQTVAEGGGGRTDLSVLTASLLEALGETCALVELPGGTMMAVRLSLRPGEAGAALAGLADPVVIGGEVWAPLDPWAARGSLLAAWRKGAERWKAAGLEAEGRLSVVAAARARYRAGGFPSSAFAVAPAAAPLSRALRAEVSRLVDAQWIASAPTAAVRTREPAAAEAPAGPRRMLVAVESKDGGTGGSSADSATLEKSVAIALATLEGGPLVIEQGSEPFPADGAARGAAARARGADSWALVTLAGKPGAPAVSAQVADLAAGKLFPARPLTLLRGLAPEDASRESWDDLRAYVLASVGGDAAEAAGVRASAAPDITLTVRAVPGTLVTGLPGGPLYVGTGGASSQSIPRPGSFALSAAREGFFTAAREVFVDSDRELYFLQEPRSPLSVRLGFMSSFFPSPEALLFITPGALYLSAGATTFVIGVGTGGQDLLTSIPLTEITAGLGSFFFPESWLLRPYLEARGFLRLTSLAGSLRLDPLSPGGVRAAVGAELSAGERLKLFVEWDPAFFSSAYPELLEASLAANRTTAGYFFLPVGALAFPYGRFGVRWVL